MNFRKFSLVARPRVVVAVLGLITIGFCGCGGRDVPVLDETQVVEAVVTAIGDAAGDEAAFKAMFVDGAAPEDRRTYFSAAISMVGPPTIEGDTATATVKVTQGNAESEGKGGTKSTKVADGEATWTLQKVSGEWKLKDAPLPEV